MNIRVRVLAILCGAVAGFAAADTYPTVYLKANSSYSTGFAGATWVDANGTDVTIDDPANYDFVIRKYYIDPSSGETITAHKITVGEVGGTSGNLRGRYSATYNTTEGLVFANGSMYNVNQLHTIIAGKIVVTAPSSAPFLFYTTHTERGGFTFPGAFEGAEGTGFHINSPVSGYYTEIPNAAGYQGDIEVTATNATGAAADARLVLTAVAAGTVRIGADCTLEFTNSAAQASVKNLVLADGSTLKLYLPSVPPAAPLLTVGESLTKGEGARMTFDISAVTLPVDEIMAYPVISAPESMLSEDMFEIDETSSPWGRLMLSRTVDQATGMATIWGTLYPLVTMVNVGDETTYSQDASSAMTNSAQWSDGQIVHSGAHYYMSRLGNKATYLRTPWLPEGSFTFPGESLTLAWYGNLIIASGEFICPLLYVDSSSASYVRTTEATNVTYRGDIQITRTQNLTISIYNQHRFTLDGVVSGVSDLTLAAGTAGSSFDRYRHRGDFSLTKKNPDFTGKVTVTSESADARLRWTDYEPYAHVYYADPLCFGGPLPAFAYDALTITKMSRLITTNEVTFSDMTRGWLLSGIAQLETPAEGDSLTLLQPVTVNGCVYKQGAGTLAMGGTMKFLDAEGALTDTPPDDASKRTLFVQGGAIKPLSADSFNGLDIVFSNSVNVAGVNVTDVALDIDLDAEDADLRAYGLRNTKSPSPLALSLAGGATKVPVRLLADAADISGTYTVGVMTVKSTVADETFAKLDILKPEGFKVERRVTVDAEAGTSTLVVTIKQHGFKVILR